MPCISDCFFFRFSNSHNTAYPLTKSLCPGLLERCSMEDRLCARMDLEVSKQIHVRRWDYAQPIVKIL